MEARDIYHKMKAIAEPIHAYNDQFVAIAKWIEAEFIYNPRNKIDITRKDLYEYDKSDLRERTEKRLIQINEMGMEEVGIAQFGIKGIMSGLYLEKIWSYSDEAWNDYIEWVESLIK